MKKRGIALSAAMLIILGAGTAHAGDAVLFTPMLSPPVGGTLVCNVTNVGKKPIPLASIRLATDTNWTEFFCIDVPSVADSPTDHTCFHERTTNALCWVTIEGGNHRSVRAVLNVVDSSGATILSVPATKVELTGEENTRCVLYL